MVVVVVADVFRSLYVCIHIVVVLGVAVIVVVIAAIGVVVFV